MARRKKELTVEQQTYIARLMKHIEPLRQAAGLSQVQLAEKVGMSKPAYALALRNKEISWKTFLALMFFFDHNDQTHKKIREMEIFPAEFLNKSIQEERVEFGS